MIISASRRTDIPAFFSKWFINRIRAGYCTVVNPYNNDQVSYVSLLPADVDVIVFWTKDPSPLIPYLHELDALGHKYYFQYTINAYGKEFEPSTPSAEDAVMTFKNIAEQIGPEKVIWRYDPICISNITDLLFHKTQYAKFAKLLKNSTFRSVISIVDNYKRAESNFKRLSNAGIKMETRLDESYFYELLTNIAESAHENCMEVFSCAEEYDFSTYGISSGKCIDDRYINKIWGLSLDLEKDKNQRKECGCVASKDIGAYDTCLHGCAYCYATTLEKAKNNFRLHDPESPSILGYHDAPKPSANDLKPDNKRTTSISQIRLFD